VTPSSAMATWPAVGLRRSPAAPSPADDATRIDRFLRSGNEDDFEVLVRRYRNKVFRLAVSILGAGAESDAEDVTQEVFVAVLRQLKTFRGQSAFSTWLYRVARNQIIDYRRRTPGRTTAVADDALREIPDDGARADAQGLLAAARRRERLMRHIGRLSEPQRVVVYLHYWQGESVAEIADMLGLGPNTVKSHLFRARRQLAVALREDGRDA